MIKLSNEQFITVANYIVFEREKDFVFADTKELINMCEDVVDITDRVSSFRDANYKVWGRSYQGKKDLISRIEMCKIIDLKNTFIWKKGIDFDNTSMI